MPTPAQYRDRWRGIVHKYRSLPGALGLRPHTVSVRIASSAGTHTGDGAITGDWTDIVEAGGHAPKVRWATDEQIALGQLEKGTAIVGPVTPEFSAGGTPLDLLSGDDAAATDLLQFRITGPRHPDGATYALVDAQCERALHYTLRLRPITKTL